MRVFITGASGWIGSAAVDELLAAGHDVTGLVRSDASAAALAAKGVQVRRGDLDDLAGIRAGAADADAVLHLANKHDFADPMVSNKAERDAVEAIGETLAGSDRPFLLASGVAIPMGRPLVETDPAPFHGLESPRGGAENLALSYVERGVRTVALRFAPTVHGHRDHGFLATLTDVARKQGTAGYPGDGSNRWPAVHRQDAATLIRLALDKAPAGSILHVVAEDGVPTRDIAGAIADSLGIDTTSVSPEDVQSHFGWIGMFYAFDIPASSTLTRKLLDWHPTAPTLLADIKAGAYTN